MCVQSTLSLKDYFPLIGTIITVTTGYYLITVQIRKNRRAKWIDDFRKEVANFFVTFTSMNKEFSIDKGYQLLNAGSMLMLYLFDSKQPPRRELIETIREVQSMIMAQKDSVSTSEYMETVSNKLARIMTLASEVILIEQAKI